MMVGSHHLCQGLLFIMLSQGTTNTVALLWWAGVAVEEGKCDWDVLLSAEAGKQARIKVGYKSRETTKHAGLFLQARAAILNPPFMHTRERDEPAPSKGRQGEVQYRMVNEWENTEEIHFVYKLDCYGSFLFHKQLQVYIYDWKQMNHPPIYNLSLLIYHLDKACH